MAFSSNGKLGAVASGNTLILFDTADWRPRTLPIKGRVTALAFSRDGAELAMAWSGRGSLSPIGVPRDRFVEIAVINAATGATLKTLTENRIAAVSDLSFAADGALIAVAGRVDPNRPREPRLLEPNPAVAVDDVLLWNVNTGRMTSVMPQAKSHKLRGFF
jgi:hypothetical protein